MTYAYPLAVDTWTAEERDAAKRVIDSGRCTMGAEVEAFEEEFARHVGAKHAIMVNSGSSANLLAVRCALRAEGMRGVVVSALTWPTTVWPILQCGLTPHFTDVDLDTMCMSASLGQDAFFTHVLSANEVTDPLLEDACEALDGWKLRGLAGTCSFYFAHHISTVEGGMIVTNHDDRPYRCMRSHGWARGIYPNVPGLDPRFTFVGEGYNLKPTDIAAAIGRVQLRRLPGMLRGRKEGAEAIAELLPEWLLTPRPRAWMMFPMRLREDAPVSRDAVVDMFEREGVETRPIVGGNLLRHPAFAEYRAHTPNADIIHERGLMIGCPPHVEDAGVAALENALAKLRAL